MFPPDAPAGAGHILVEPYCILCRSSTHHCFRNDEEEGIESWERDVMCFFELPANNEEGAPKGYMFRDRLPFLREAPPAANETLRKVLNEAGLRLCSSPGDGKCSLEYTANMVHIPCLKLAWTRLPHVSISLLCRIARLLRPVVAWRNSMPLFKEHGDLSSFPRSGLASTQLGLTVQRIGELFPNELQQLICHQLPRDLLSTLANTCETLNWIEEYGLTTKTTLSRPLSTYFLLSLGSFVGANSIPILNENCLVQISSDSSKAWDHKVAIASDRVEGIQFVLGLYGVLGLRFCYQDGTLSPWLGRNPPPRWTSFITGADLSTLWVESDDAKILSLGFARSEKHPPEYQSPQILWDQDVMLSQVAKCSVMKFYPFLRSVVDIRGSHKSRYTNYLSLDLKDDERHSLTVFCAADAICCIQIDGNPQRRLGEPSEKCCPITFFLEAGEKIHSLVVVTRRSREIRHAQGPFLLVHTTSGRSLYYGPYIMPLIPISQAHLSSFGYERTHIARGVFTSPSSSLSGQGLRSLGVHLEPSDQQEAPASMDDYALCLPVLSRLDSAFFLDKYPWMACISKATFINVDTLKVQRSGDRCKGLLAMCHGQAPVTLGQWDPSTSLETSTIYSKKEGPLNSITFVFSEGASNGRCVNDIVLGEYKGTKPHFTWQNLSAEIAWHFTYQFDLLDLWQGRTIDVPVTENAVPYSIIA